MFLTWTAILCLRVKMGLWFYFGWESSKKLKLKRHPKDIHWVTDLGTVLTKSEDMMALWQIWTFKHLQFLQALLQKSYLQYIKFKAPKCQPRARGLPWKAPHPQRPRCTQRPRHLQLRQQHRPDRRWICARHFKFMFQESDMKKVIGEIWGCVSDDVSNCLQLVYYRHDGMYNVYDLYDYLIGQCNAMKRTGCCGRVIAASSWQYGEGGKIRLESIFVCWLVQSHQIVKENMSVSVLQFGCGYWMEDRISGCDTECIR